MHNIHNIIFDFGGVIINIDPNRIGTILTQKGVDNLLELHEHLFSKDIYKRLETGHVSPQQFRDEIKSILSINVSNEDIDEAWNAIILDIPPERVRLLESIRNNYNTYLLSNTNSIHFDFYNQYFARTFGYTGLSDLFEKAYFSHEMGLRKPNPEIFRVVLADAGLTPEKTLFIDDNAENVKVANDVGIQGHHLNDGTELTSLFKDDKLII